MQKQHGCTQHYHTSLLGRIGVPLSSCSPASPSQLLVWSHAALRPGALPPPPPGTGWALRAAFIEGERLKWSIASCTSGRGHGEYGRQCCACVCVLRMLHACMCVVSCACRHAGVHGSVQECLCVRMGPQGGQGKLGAMCIAVEHRWAWLLTYGSA